MRTLSSLVGMYVSCQDFPALKQKRWKIEFQYRTQKQKEADHHGTRTRNQCFSSHNPRIIGEQHSTIELSGLDGGIGLESVLYSRVVARVD